MTVLIPGRVSAPSETPAPSGRGKVVLVFPPVTSADRPVDEYHSLPMGLLLIATLLRHKGFEPRFIDCSFHPDYLDRVVGAVRDDDCLYVGISVMTSQVRSALELSTAVKRARPSLPVVWGGFHPTLFPEQTVAHPAVDVCVIDEGERASLDLAETFLGRKPVSDVVGIAYMTPEGPTRSAPGRRLDFGDLPPLDYDLVDPERYISQPVSRFGPGHPPARALPLLTGLGCRFRCAFCMNALLRRPYRTLPAPDIIEQSRELVERYGIEDFTFVDEHFFGDRERLRSFADLKQASDLTYTWDTNARASDFGQGRLDADFLGELRRSGLTRLGIGAESGSQRILDLIRKGIKVDQVRQAAASLEAAGIAGAFSFMVGLPSETAEEYDATYGLCADVLAASPHSTIIGPQLFRPYPGSELYEDAVSAHGLTEPEDLEGWGRVAAENEGYFAADKLPWVTEPEALALRSFYLGRLSAPVRDRSRLEQLAVDLFRGLAGSRLKRGFYRFPLEYRLYRTLRAGADDAGTT